MGEDVCEMASEASDSMCHAVTTQSGVERLSNAELSAFSYSGLCHQLFSTQRSGAAALNSHVLWNAHQRLFSASGRRAFASALNDQRSKSTALDRFAFDMLERLFITALHESRRHQTDGNLSAAQQTDEVRAAGAGGSVPAARARARAGHATCRAVGGGTDPRPSSSGRSGVWVTDAITNMP